MCEVLYLHGVRDLPLPSVQRGIKYNLPKKDSPYAISQPIPEALSNIIHFKDNLFLLETV